jgi:hypothetical protein
MTPPDDTAATLCAQLRGRPDAHTPLHPDQWIDTGPGPTSGATRHAHTHRPGGWREPHRPPDLDQHAHTFTGAKWRTGATIVTGIAGAGRTPGTTTPDTTAGTGLGSGWEPRWELPWLDPVGPECDALARDYERRRTLFAGRREVLIGRLALRSGDTVLDGAPDRGSTCPRCGPLSDRAGRSSRSNPAPSCWPWPRRRSLSGAGTTWSCSTPRRLPWSCRSGPTRRCSPRSPRYSGPRRPCRTSSPSSAPERGWPPAAGTGPPRDGCGGCG